MVASDRTPRGILGEALKATAYNKEVGYVFDAHLSDPTSYLGRGKGHLRTSPWRRKGAELVKVVAIGGGTGLPVVLAALRRHLAASDHITAIVTAADDGGSSGALRKAYGVIPPGDIRNCLLALARVPPEVSAALQYRFDDGDAQHPVGNLLLAALDMVATDALTAIKLAAELLAVDDLVLPSTTERVHLVAELADGRSVYGESSIPRSGASIKRVRI